MGFQVLSVVNSSRHSSVCRATGYGLDGQGWIQSRSKVFLYSTVSKPVLKPIQPLIHLVSGALFLRVKWPRREADHSPPFNAEVKNGGATTPFSICFYGLVQYL
jgi:hypothetical protein